MYGMSIVINVQISNGHVSDERVGGAPHMVYRRHNVNYHNVTDQRKDKNQNSKHGGTDLNIWRYGIRTSTARFRCVVGSVRKQRYCEEN